MIPKDRRCLIHGEYVRIDNDNDAYVGFIKDCETNEQEMVIFDNPEVQVYVTEPSKRIYHAKREYANKKDCICYKTRYNRIAQTLQRAIDDPFGTSRMSWRQQGFVNLRKILSNPYVYGADIDIGVRIKHAFKKQNGGRMPTYYNVGSLDIETDVTGNNQIILITYIDGSGKTYVGILKEFFQNNTIDAVDKMWHKVEEKFVASLKSNAAALYQKNRIDPTYMIFDEEISLIKWIFDRIHDHRPDFCVIWNMGYDIPYLLERIVFRGEQPTDVFCSKDVPQKYRVTKYVKDNGKPGDHITDRWDWFHCTDYTRYIDAMALYGRLRKAKGREPSYKLDDIGTKEIGAGKLEFGSNKGHYEMQTREQVAYTVYNIVDVAILHVMNLKNRDIYNMIQLIGVSNLEDFAKQTIQLKNTFYEYLDPQDKIPASIGESMESPWDIYINNKGGAVLDPSNTMNTGVPILKESDAVSNVHKFVCDIDVSSMYPNLLRTLNCARETKEFYVIQIDNSERVGPIDVNQVMPSIFYPEEMASVHEGLVPERKFDTFDVEKFFLHSLYTRENASLCGSEYFNLPTYEEMDRLVKEKLNPSSAIL